MVDPLGGSPSGPIGPGPTPTGSPSGFGPKEPDIKGNSFVELFESSINEVNHLQWNSGAKMRKLVTGEIESLHEVMIASEEAGLAFNLLMQIRNKLLTAWNELKRMPV